MNVGQKKKTISSCFECIAIKSCYGSTHPDLEKKEARLNASNCTSIRKGFSTETIKVVNSEKGVSRKKAEKLVEERQATWVEDKTIERFDNSTKAQTTKDMAGKQSEKLFYY